MSNGQANFYCWPETTAHRGSNEVASLLFHYVNKLKNIDTLYLFSDSCGGQNKNTTIIHLPYTLIKLGIFKRIQHVFPVRGHSFLPCDRDFGLIEQKKRRVDRIYTPSQWIDMIKTARRDHPFEVIEVNQGMFFDFHKHLSTFLKKTVQQKKEKLKIRDVRVFEYSEEHIDEVWAKYYDDVQDEWHKFTVEKKKTKKTSSTILSLLSEPSSHGILPLTQSKVDDLKKIIFKYVPRESRSFYDEIIQVCVDSSDNSCTE